MHYAIDIDGTMVPYRVRSVARSRSVRISVNARGELVVSKPARLHRMYAQRFVETQRDWIATRLAHARSEAAKHPRVAYDARAKRAALALVRARLAHFNELYRFRIGKLSIRNQRTRWGSCSRGGDLSFNYRITALQPRLADYLVVHELCHIGEHNHSQRFWALVAQHIPEYRALRAELRTIPLV